MPLDSHIDGYAVGFWSRPHYWFGLRVGPTPVKKGRQWITRDDVNDDPLLNAIFGGPTGTGEIRPSSFSGGIRYPDIVVVVADQLAAKRLADTRGASNMPIDGRALDTFPTILETSKSPWFIAWVSPSIVQTEGPFKLNV
ncbi:hypothetical protein JQ629_22860 [Bradyrhizobium sp. AUGA SZCCT0222]|uniref:hypothetical protein n=1 Tax=Bradyrhizobium sp. AUGA SZCCT0222 TaxID=2807668 RepID=UPI001BA6D0F5|nr:hypothetical protein [Bradyrhizobium sp. AUGA SZCCT0222]MBR1270320.1 hypothetical protein [Bradyrhizobium sp. AUGA SZCCT0222]